MLNIKVVGPGCVNCEKLYSLCREVIEENNIPATISKVTDMNQIADLGVFVTPGLVINGVAKSSGKIPTRHTLLHWLQNAQ